MIMKSTSILAIAITLWMSAPVHTAEKVQPVRMGCGQMTFDTVPGWGLLPDGKSALGPTHGSVVIDNVEPKIGSGQFVPFSGSGPMPQRGDMVVIGG